MQDWIDETSPRRRGAPRPPRFPGRAGHLALSILAFALAAGPPAARAQGADPHAVQPERPTVATHAFTVAPGWVEIEAGVERDRYGDRTVGATAPVEVKVGLTPHLQLDLDGSLVHLPATGVTGFGDLALGLKWHAAGGLPLVGDLALLGVLKAPTAPTASGLGTGTSDVALVLISSHRFGDFSLDVNAGWTRRSGSGARVPRSANLWTVSVGGPAIGALGWTAEVYGYPGTAGPAGAAPIVAVLGGPTLLARRYLAFDAGLIAPLAGPQPRAVYCGAVWNVGRL